MPAHRDNSVLLFLITEDWTFWLHRLSTARGLVEHALSDEVVAEQTLALYRSLRTHGG